MNFTVNLDLQDNRGQLWIYYLSTVVFYAENR